MTWDRDSISNPSKSVRADAQAARQKPLIPHEARGRFDEGVEL